MSGPLSDILPAFFVKLKSLPGASGVEPRLAFKLSPITFQSGDQAPPLVSPRFASPVLARGYEQRDRANDFETPLVPPA